MKSAGVGMWEAVGAIVESADDVRIDRAMPIAPLQLAALVGSALEAVVKDAAGLRRIAGGIQTKVPRSQRAVIDRTVTHIYRKTRRRKLSLSEAPAREPGKIAR